MGGHSRIVGVEHQGSLPGQGLDEFRFGPTHSFHAAHPLGVGRMNIEQHSHRRFADFGEAADFPKAVHAHLHHRGVKATVQLEEGLG